MWICSSKNSTLDSVSAFLDVDTVTRLKSPATACTTIEANAGTIDQSIETPVP